MSNPVKHHYVPQFYLSRWCNDEGKVPFFMRQKDGAILESKVIPKATAFENNLYSYEKVPLENRQAVEKFFGTIIESQAAPVLNKLLAGDIEKLTDDERQSWARFLTASRLRVPEWINDIKKSASEELVRSLIEDHEGFVDAGGDSSDTLTAWVERNMVGLIDNFGLMILPEVICDPSHISFFCGMHWWVEDLSQASVSLLTSDRPLWISTDLKKPTGLLALPLSPTHVFFSATNKQLQLALQKGGASKMARRCNTSIVQQAARFVYGCAKANFVNRYLRGEK